MIPLNRVVSLWDMLEINALSFIAAIANLRGIAAIAGAMDEKEIAATLLEETRKVVLCPSSEHLAQLAA